MKNSILALALIVSVSCGQKPSSSNKIKQIFVKGDPLTMVKGTEKNTVPFLTSANVMEFQGYALSSLNIFAEKELLTQEESRDIESGNEAEESDQTTSSKLLFSTKMVDVGEYVFEDPSSQISFHFKKDWSDSMLHLKELRLGTQEFQVKIEHYSISSDKSKMSLLFRLKTPQDGNVLLNAVFYKANANPVVIPKTSSTYRYIYGPGVIVPWKLGPERAIQVDVCPSTLSYLTIDEVREAFKKWERPFTYKTNKLNIDVRSVKSCKPFSDVEQHALHYVDEYLTVPDDHSYNPGFALVNADTTNGYIFDADIILLGAESRKDPQYNSIEIDRTLAHEFGHFLGLDHQFEGYTSIMSYDSVYFLGNYDYQAIQELYP